MTNLVEDFTKLNVQLNDYKAKVYDLENRKKSYSSEVKQLQKQVNEAEVKLRRKSITLKKTKDGDILEKLVEDNDNYREQVHILKNTIREMSEKMKKQAQSGQLPPRQVRAQIVVAHQKRQQLPVMGQIKKRHRLEMGVLEKMSIATKQRNCRNGWIL